MDWNFLARIARDEVRATLRSLPTALRDRAERLPVTLERHPSRDLQKDGIDADTLGLFVGEAFPEDGWGPAPLPPQILLFLDNLWDFAEEDEEIYREEIRTTLLHELGHYLGLDEIDLEDRGLD